MTRKTHFHLIPWVRDPFSGINHVVCNFSRGESANPLTISLDGCVNKNMGLTSSKKIWGEMLGAGLEPDRLVEIDVLSTPEDIHYVYSYRFKSLFFVDTLLSAIIGNKDEKGEEGYCDALLRMPVSAAFCSSVFHKWQFESAHNHILEETK